jgi:hypothetical protein
LHPGVDNVRRADAEHPLDFRRGRDFQGRYLFVLDGRGSINSVATAPSLEGVSIDLQEQPSSDFRLVLTLQRQDDIELFRALSLDLMSATRGVRRGESVRGLALVFARLHRWQEMLGKCREGVLSRQEIIGLVGELLFLRDCLLGTLGPKTAVASWRGPYGDEQDFLISGSIFEIKTQIATADSRLQISSEHQLDIASGSIFVAHQTLSTAGSAVAGALTLNGLVSAVSAAIPLGDTETLDLFRLGLIESRYAARREYDETAWILVTRRLYSITEPFPRVVPSGLPRGITKVQYSIAVDACESFAVDVDETVRRLTDGRD